MSLLDTASLIVTPNAVKEGKLYSVIPSDGSGDLSVTRATTATRVNSAGLVELVPYNLCDYSEDQTQWTSQDETTVTANSTTAPNGTLTADTVTPTAVNTDHYRGIVLSSQVGELTAFIYVKPNGYNFFDWGIWNGSQYLVRATFDLVNLTYTFTNAGTATIESVGNGWLKCGISGSNASLSTIALYYRVRPTGGTGGFTGNGTSGAFIWGAQLNIGSTALPYQKTETRLNIPRLDYSNGTCPSLLVEPQRTNVLDYSSSFNSGFWLTFNGSVTGNTTISPDGTTTADTLTSNATTGGSVYRLVNTSGTNTASCFFKAGTSNLCNIGFSNGANVTYNLSTQAITTSGSITGSIEDFGNGWYRCIATITATSTFIAFANNGTTGTTIFLWGAQLEAGSYATSYIPTTSASVTRNADVISKTSISSLIGQTEGTIFGEIYAKQVGSAQNWFEINDGTSANWIFIGKEGTKMRGFIRANATTYFDNTSFTITDNAPMKVALAYKSGNYALYINGTQIASGSSSFTISNTISVVGFNNLIAVGDSSQFKAAALWKTRLTNTQLAQLTTI
jgi:hypothetical protein